MTVHGSVNHILNSTSHYTGLTNPDSGGIVFADAIEHFENMFIATHKFMISANAAALGISLVASNFGNGTSTCDYRVNSHTGSLGNTAWAVYKFDSASTRFYLLTYFQKFLASDASRDFEFDHERSRTITIFEGNSVTLRPGFGISVAMREDGNSPWNGTTNADGTDTVGSARWTAGGSKLAIFPISNGFRGQDTVKKNCVHLLSSDISERGYEKSNYSIFNVIASQEFITFNVGLVSGITHDYFYFGKYKPYTNTITKPYCCIGYQNPSLQTQANQQIVTTSGGGKYDADGKCYGTNINQGPTDLSINKFFGGIVNHSDFYMTKMGVSLPFGIDEQIDQYKKRLLLDNIRGKTNIANLLLFNNGTETKGYVGELENVRICHTIPINSTLFSKTYAVIGSRRETLRLIIPWVGSTAPGKIISVSGEQY